MTFHDQDRSCHPFAAFRASSECSEGSESALTEILRFAQDDRGEFLPMLVVKNSSSNMGVHNRVRTKARFPH
jgi:hypothetical protein